MKRLLPFCILSAGILAAQGPETFLRGIEPEDHKGPQPIRAFPSAGDRVLPQIATGSDGRGGGFFMIFQIFNLTERAVNVTVGFFDSQGRPMRLPLEPTGEFPAIGGSIPARGMGLAATRAAGPIQVGYALLDAPASDSSNLQSSVAVNAIFNQVVPGRPIFQAGVPLSTALHDRFFVPFINAGGFTSTLALVNVLAQRVTFIARSTAGAELCQSSRLMGALEHSAFVIQDQLPCAAGQIGVVEVRGPQSGLSGIGFLAQDDGAFVTQTVFGLLPTS